MPETFNVSLELGAAGTRRSAVPAGDRCRLLDPARQQLLVELVGLAHVQRADAALGLADGRDRLERGSLEEGELHMALEGCEGEEPTLPLHAVERAVPSHGLADIGH